MSVSLIEILDNAGYDIKNNIDDVRWFLSQKDCFEEMVEEAEITEELYIDYTDYELSMWKKGLIPHTFKEWRQNETTK